MLESVISAVVRALEAAGLEAAEAFPDRRICCRDTGLVCVGIKSARGLPAGFGGYLGMGTDPATGLSEELFGARCQLELALDIYAGGTGGAHECLRCAGIIPQALGALPEGIKISSLTFGQAGPDGRTGLFLCSGVLAATAFFIARTAEEDDCFTDFILRGSVSA